MPLIIEGRVPAHWGERKSRLAHTHLFAKSVKVTLINNMPDPALEDTERQFFELLDDASGDLPVVLKLCALAGVSRSDRGLPHLNSFYFGIENLWNEPFDALIMTGTEPRQSDLRQEPYWREMAEVLDWAEDNTFSTVLSCLAAHAGVLHSDGIPRRSLPDKLFGVFDSGRVCVHPLTASLGEFVRFPHSRWNDVGGNDLKAHGYTLLTQSHDGGVDLFAKSKGKSLVVYFQGHPEYGAQTLLKEYRRDVKRFLRGERTSYPSMPRGYFHDNAARAMASFQQEAVNDPREDLMTLFPYDLVSDELSNTWRSSAIAIYRNWLQYVYAKKADASSFVAFNTRLGSVRLPASR